MYNPLADAFQFLDTGATLHSLGKNITETMKINERIVHMIHFFWMYRLVIRVHKIFERGVIDTQSLSFPVNTCGRNHENAHPILECRNLKLL